MPIPAVMNSHVSRTRGAVTDLIAAFEKCLACAQEYGWLDPAVVASYWQDQPDRDTTPEQHAAAIAAILSIRATVNSGTIGADLYRVKV